jgi:hypothetical protein
MLLKSCTEVSPGGPPSSQSVVDISEILGSRYGGGTPWLSETVRKRLLSLLDLSKSIFLFLKCMCLRRLVRGHSALCGALKARPPIDVDRTEDRDLQGKAVREMF